MKTCGLGWSKKQSNINRQLELGKGLIVQKQSLLSTLKGSQKTLEVFKTSNVFCDPFESMTNKFLNGRQLIWCLCVSRCF